MGIGDRAYMRNQRLAREPISVTAWVVGTLVAFFILNLIQESAGADLLGWAILRESSPMAWQWLTHGLLHDGFWHLLGNGLILWWTGAIVEREHGPRALLATLAAGTLFGASVNIGRNTAGTSPPSARPIFAPASASRNRPGYGIVSSASQRRNVSPGVRTACFSSSIRARNGLIKSRYGTPLGHAGSHDRQPRQRSTCGCASAHGNVPSSTCFIRTIRPRGESISCPNS